MYSCTGLCGSPGKISTLVGGGGRSFLHPAAVPPFASYGYRTSDADDEEVAQAISVIYLFNILAAILFSGFRSFESDLDTHSGEAFGILAGTAVNDTSSVTAAASKLGDSLYHLGSATLDKAVTVKLTRTLAIIPITLVLAFVRAKNAKEEGNKVEFKKIFPFFILYFVGASIITTAAVSLGVPAGIFSPLKTLSKFFIVMAMGAIGLNTNVVKLIKDRREADFHGGLLLGRDYGVSLVMQKILGIW